MDTPSADTPFNPYRPPENGPQTATLSPDTEFMVSSECVLCGPEVALPEVCIRTGNIDELERQSDILRWTPVMLHRMRVLLPGFGLPFAAQVLIVASRQPMGATSTLEQVPTAAWLTLVLIIVLTPTVMWYAQRTTRSVQATWYVERGLIDRRRQKQKAWKITAGVLAFLFIVALVLSITVSSSCFPFTFWTGLPAILSLIQSRRLIQPQIVGTHQGLNIPAGFPPLFLQEVLSIVKRRPGNTP
jgi:hypothetical protein